MSAATNRQISQDFVLRIERLTNDFVTSRNNTEAKTFGKTTIKISPRLYGSNTSRSKTPEMNSKRHINKRNHIEDTHYNTEDSSTDSSTKKLKGLKCSQLENVRERLGVIDTIGIENKNPNKMEHSLSKDLLVLLNKEKEAVGYLKAELQKTCLDSRKEKAELQKKIHELNKTNTECYKQIAHERSSARQALNDNKALTQKYESVSTQNKVLINGFTELIEKIVKQTVDLKTMETIIMNTLEEANKIEGGTLFSDELIKVKKLAAQTKENTKDESLYTENLKPNNILLLNEVVLPEITVSEITYDIEDRSSLLRTINNLNEDFDEDFDDLVDDLSPEQVSAIPRKCPGMQTNALKDLEELKARLALNKKKLAHVN